MAFAIALRLTQGASSGANAFPFPSTPPVSASKFDASWFSQILLYGLGGPVVEEVFFRGVLLVSVYQLFRRSTGHVSALATAVLVSSGMFVMLHAVFSPVVFVDGLQLFLLGAVCSLLVVFTGRFWPALITHAIYNLTFFLLALTGSILAT